MTEAQWLACEEPRTLLVYLISTAGIRELRLALCACVERGGVPRQAQGPPRLKRLVGRALDWVAAAAEETEPGEPPEALRFSILKSGRSSSSAQAPHWVKIGCCALSESCNVYYVADALAACSPRGRPRPEAATRSGPLGGTCR